MPQSGRRLAEKELGEAFTPSAWLHDDLGNGSQAGLAVVSALRFRLSGSGRAPPPCRQRIRGGQRRAVERDLGGTGYRRRPLRPIPMGAGRRVGALPSDGPGQEGVGSHGDPEARVAGRDCAADQDRGAAPVARSAYDDGRGRDVVGEPGQQGGRRRRPPPDTRPRSEDPGRASGAARRTRRRRRAPEARCRRCAFRPARACLQGRPTGRRRCGCRLGPIEALSTGPGIRSGASTPSRPERLRTPRRRPTARTKRSRVPASGRSVPRAAAAASRSRRWPAAGRILRNRRGW